MESLPEQNMQERPIQQQHLEAPFVRIARNITREKLPGQHTESFDMTFDEINRQITGEGLFLHRSKIYEGVSFLAGHLQITPELIEKIAKTRQSKPGYEPPARQKETPNEEPKEPKIEHYVYFIEPAFGKPPDGSALSALDLAIDRFIKEMPKVAAAIRRGEKPPTIDIYMLGGPAALGASVTKEFVDEVKQSGFEPYGKLYAEFVEQYLSIDKDTLSKTKVVLQGASKGTITTDQTFKSLSSQIKDDLKGRLQLLYDNPAGTHDTQKSVLNRKTVRLGVGTASELLRRERSHDIPAAAFAGQKQFYDDILRAKRIPQDSKEQKKLKGELFLRGEVKTIAKGTPLDSSQRAFVRISTTDPVNPDFENKRRVDQIRDEEREKLKDAGRLGLKPKPTRGIIAKQNGSELVFATAHTYHNYPWERSVLSGSWSQKMEFVENTPLPKPQQQEVQNNVVQQT